MTATKPEPAFVAPQRAAKAERIVRVLRDGLGMGADEAARLTPRQRHEVEHVAGVKPGSQKTWTLVVEMLAGSHMPNALCPTCGHGDPAGVPGPPKPFGHDGPCSA
jgi:hypothetical protein